MDIQLNNRNIKIRNPVDLYIDRSMILSAGFASVVPKFSCKSQILSTLTHQIEGQYYSRDSAAIFALSSYDAVESARLAKKVTHFKKITIADLGLASLLDALLDESHDVCLVALGSPSASHLSSHTYLDKSIKDLALYSSRLMEVLLSSISLCENLNEFRSEIVIQEKSGRFSFSEVSQASKMQASKKLKYITKSNAITSAVIHEDFERGWTACAANLRRSPKSDENKINITAAHLYFSANHFEMLHLDQTFDFLKKWINQQLDISLDEIRQVYIDGPSPWIFVYIQQALAKRLLDASNVEFSYSPFFFGRNPIRTLFEILKKPKLSLYISTSDFPRIDLLVVRI